MTYITGEEAIKAIKQGVTEYGIAYLYGKNMRHRAKALIEIAHPNHRGALEKAAFERFHSYEFDRTVY